MIPRAVGWTVTPRPSPADRTINPHVERFVHLRAGMTTMEVDSSHLVMLANPKEATDLIHEAARSPTA